MDDRTFDKQSALDWIEMIESEAARGRETGLYPQLNSWLDQISAKEILDIGSGQGICSEYINLKNRNYTGIEPSPYLLNRALELYGVNENRHFVSGNAYSLPVANSYFDAVFSVAVWHLLEDINLAAAELSRVIQPSGHFLIITADPKNYPAWIERYTSQKQEGRRFKGETLRPDGSAAEDTLILHTYEEIEASLAAHGLNIQKSESKGFFISIYGDKIKT